ncbi:MAG: type II secretion system protein GspN, partial [Deltaproteobacteria bacterium]|nr:type II secretion system protein GspN [Kofleriaceae bacterium]
MTAVHLSPRARFALKIAGFVFLGIVTFVYALHLTFPYERVAARMKEALATKYIVTISKVERSAVPGRFRMKGVTLTSRPSVEGQPVTTMFFQSVEVDVSFIPLLGGRAEVGLDIATGSGGMTGDVRMSKSSLNVDFRLKRMPLSTIPGIADAVGLPLGGLGDGRIRLDLPKNDWTKASGRVDLSCTVGCTVGDGVARVYPKAKREADALMVKDGFPVETIDISRFVLGIAIAKGEAKRDKFEFESPDGDIAIDFNIKLAKKIDDSIITGCIRYRCSGDYLAKSPAACELGSPAVDSDGFRNIKLTGKLDKMRRLGSVCEAGDSPDDVFTKDEGTRVRTRPALDDIPEPQAAEPAPTPTPTPPPIEPPDMGRPPSTPDVNTMDANGMG